MLAFSAKPFPSASPNFRPRQPPTHSVRYWTQSHAPLQPALRIRRRHLQEDRKSSPRRKLSAKLSHRRSRPRRALSLRPRLPTSRRTRALDRFLPPPPRRRHRGRKRSKRARASPPPPRRSGRWSRRNPADPLDRADANATAIAISDLARHRGHLRRPSPTTRPRRKASPARKNPPPSFPPRSKIFHQDRHQRASHRP